MTHVDGAKATVRITRYTVSCFPESHPDSSSWDITVEERAPGRWSVGVRSWVIGRRGRYVYEPNPSSRTDAFKRAYRFDLDTALKIAVREAPKVVVNGMTPKQVLERFPWHGEQA